MSRVGFLGPEGTYSHEAALTVAGQDELVALVTNHDVVLAVQDGRVDRAIVAVESAAEGAVNATLDALAFSAPDVVVELELVHRVRHCIVGLGPLTGVEEIRSHPQALAQCAGWLRRHLPGVPTAARASSAAAAREAADDASVGAIASRTSASRHGVEVLAEDVGDGSDDVTRFFGLVHREAVLRSTGADKTSVLFHGDGDGSPGWLVRCLSEFAFRGVNLSRIESRPLRSQLGHYLFHVDCSGAVGEPAVDDALAALRGHCEEVRVLGSYASATVPVV